ncbi:MAG: alpha/beta fold hydrolase [Bacteroidota bacterium]
MNNSTLHLHHFLVGLLILFSVYACNESEEVTPQTNAFLVDHEEVIAISSEELKVIAAFTGFGEYQDLIEYGLTLYKITYRTDFKGERVEASGLIAVPQGNERFPLLLGAHGTITDNSQAPSNLNFAQNSTSGFELFASFGFVSIIPDYLGFGASSDLVHPYFDYQSSAQSSIDMIKTTQEFLDEQQVAFNPELILTGYSQGGYVAMATLRYLEENVDPLLGVDVIATAAGAGGYDIRRGTDIILQDSTYSVPANLAFLVYAYQQTNDWTRPLTDFFQQPYASLIPGLFDGSATTITINEQLTTDLNALFQPQFLANMRDGTETEFLAALDDNSIHDWAPQSPVRLYHEIKDKVVPEPTSASTFQLMQQNGATDIAYFPFDLVSDHRAGVQPMYVMAIPWIISLRSFD